MLDTPIARARGAAVSESDATGRRPQDDAGQGTYQGGSAPHGDAPQGSGATAGAPPYQDPYGQPYAQSHPQAPAGQYPPPGSAPYAQQPPTAPPYGGEYGTGYGAAGYPQQRTNNLALISLISSILGVTVLWFIGSIAGVITGHMARRQIAQSGEGGSGMATAGLIIGYVGIALTVLGVIAFIGFIAAFPAFVEQGTFAP
jgi:hypothetical protein